MSANYNSVLFAALPGLPRLRLLAKSSELLQAAKKEGGNIVAYGSLESDSANAITKRFQEKNGN